ncbi:MAG: ornithine cyclodeaminase family protein [Limnohabitans sp.]|nr:ornithine cyclodeaminase family protein [Limnohabitans sp.]
MQTPEIISESFIEKNTHFISLIEILKKGFDNQDNQTPMRHHHDFYNPQEQNDSTLLLMPSFNIGKDLGVKIVTVSPNNSKYDLPTIQGNYIYLDAPTGSIKAIMDAKSLTVKRTACTSALASIYLSRPDADSLLMIGTGALSTNLIKAHTAVRPIKKVYVWGRDYEKASNVCKKFMDTEFECIPVKTIEEKIKEVAIISSATLSPIPLILGKHLQPGQHIDLVGAYKKDTREADNETILKSSVFLDTYQGGLKESGDIVIPLKEGILKEEDIKADLFELCQNKKPGRTTETEITFFKSVGHALEDLAAASYYYQIATKEHK